MNRFNRYLPTALLAAAIAAAPAATQAQGQAPPPAPGAGQSDADHKLHHPSDTTTAQNTTTPAPAPATPGSAGPAPGMGMGMMGGGDMGPMMQQMMRGMMPMMQGMMAQRGRDRMDGPTAMMAPHRIEGRIAFLRTELNITDAQTSAWNAFADVLRAQAGGMEAMRSRMMGGQTPAGPMPGAQMPGAQAPGGSPPGGQMQAAPGPGRSMPGSGMGMMAGQGVGISFPDQADQVVQMMTARHESTLAIAATGRALYAVLSDTQKKTADELLAMSMHAM